MDAIVWSLSVFEAGHAPVIPVVLEVDGVARQQHRAGLFQLDRQ
jgi:hypothetical protein